MTVQNIAYQVPFNTVYERLPKGPQNDVNRISESLNFEISRGVCPRTPLETPAFASRSFAFGARATPSESFASVVIGQTRRRRKRERHLKM